MSGFRIEVVVKRDEKFQRITEMLRSPRGLLLAIGARLMAFVDESFKTHGRHGGPAWPFPTPAWRPLSWTTVALRKHGGSEPLQDSPGYKSSFVKSGDDTTYVEIGTNRTPLAYWQEFGTRPYTIRPVRARVLAAKLPRGPLGLIATKSMSNYLFFGKEVHHPGIPARPVLPTKEIGERLIQLEIDGYLKSLEGGA